MLALAWAACIFSNSANMLWRDVSTCFPAYFSAAALTSATSLIAAVASFFASRRTSRTNPAFIRSLCKMLKTLSGKVLIAWVRYWLYSVLTAGVNSASVDFGPTGACGAAWGVSLNDRRCCARWAAIASAMIFPFDASTLNMVSCRLSISACKGFRIVSTTCWEKSRGTSNKLPSAVFCGCSKRIVWLSSLYALPIDCFSLVYWACLRLSAARSCSTVASVDAASSATFRSSSVRSPDIASSPRPCRTARGSLSGCPKSASSPVRGSLRSPRPTSLLLSPSAAGAGCSVLCELLSLDVVFGVCSVVGAGLAANASKLAFSAKLSVPSVNKLSISAHCSGVVCPAHSTNALSYSSSSCICATRASCSCICSYSSPVMSSYGCGSIWCSCAAAM